MPNRNRNQQQGKGGKNKARRDSLESFTAPLTPKTFKKELRSASRLQFRPQQRELAGERRAEKVQRHRMRDYFDTYGQAVDKAAASSAAGYASALDKTNAAGAAAAAGDSALRAEIEAAAQKDAQLRGATYTPSTESTQATSNRRDSAALLAGVIGAQGATQNAYLADKGRIGAGERRDQLLKSHARSRSLNADRKELAKAKGDFATDYRSRARETERQFYLEQQQLAQTAKGQKITAKNAKRSARVTKRGQNITSRHNAATEATAAQNAATSAKNAKTTAQNTAHDNRHPNAGDAPSTYTVQKALSVIRTYGAGLSDKEKKAFTAQQGVDYLVAHGYSKKVARQAIKKLTGGGGGASAGPTTGHPAGP